MKKHYSSHWLLAFVAILFCGIFPLFMVGCSKTDHLKETDDVVIKEEPEKIEESPTLIVDEEPAIDLNPFYNFSSITNENGVITFGYQSECELDQVKVRVKVNDVTTDYVMSKNTWDLQLEPNVLYEFTFEAFKGDKVVHAESCTRYYIPTENYAVAFPRMEIATQDQIWPTCDYVSAPDGYMGQGITNNDYVYSTVNLFDRNSELLFSSVSNLIDDDIYAGARLKVRGNTSAYAEKKPYKIKLTDKVDLLSGLVERDAEINYTNKEWLLLASGESLKTMVGFTLSETLNMDWTPAYSYIELYINGDYRGLYILCESVGRGSGKGDAQSRCAVDKDGFIIESDAYFWNEELSFRTPYHDRPMEYTFKYPDADDIDQDSTEFQYIKNYLEEFEKILVEDSSEYLNYIDVETFAKWLLGHDILGTLDSGGSNIFLTKKDSKDSKLRMGPLWDFDSIYGLNNNFASIHNTHLFYYPDLLNHAEFVEEYLTLLTQVKEQVLLDLQNKFMSVDNEKYNELLVMNATRWNRSVVTLQQQIDKAEDYITNQLFWIESQVQA